jgi:hypothetical protein
VFQSPVELRAVRVWVDESGERSPEELPVVGLIYRVRDRWEGILANYSIPNVAPTPAGMDLKGWRYIGEEDRAEVLVWAEHGDCDAAPVPASDAWQPGSEVVTGPKDAPLGWWADRINETVDLHAGGRVATANLDAKERAPKEAGHYLPGGTPAGVWG